MKQPEELKIFLKELEPTSTPLIYVETLEYKNNEFATHLWAIKYHKDFDKPLVKEVFVESESKTLINTDFYYGGMAGWRVVFETKRTAYFGIYEPQNKLVEYKGSKIGVQKIMLWNLKDIKKLDPRLKYMKITHYSILHSIVAFIKRFREEPSLELFGKMNLDYMFTDSRAFKQKGKDKINFINWVKNNQNYIIQALPNYLFIRGCIKHNLTPEEYEQYQELMRYRTQLKSVKTDFEVKEMPKLQHYLETNKIVIEDYVDYIKKAKKVGKEIKKTCVKFPKHFDTAKEEINKLYNTFLDNQEQERLKELLKEKKKVFDYIENFSNDKSIFKTKVLYKPSELIETGEILHNCLSTYVDKVSNGTCIVFAFYKNKQPVEACELYLKKNKLELIQLRGKYNQDTMYHEKCLEQVESLISAYRC